jgi:phage shock protein E
MKNMLLKLCAAGLMMFAFSGAFGEPVWIDVRTIEEFNTDHIDGDANIPLAEISAAKLIAEYGKDAELMLYCRSGNRAGQARQLLEDAGFTKVTNAGGIDDVRTLRGLKIAAQSSPSPQ